MSMTSKERMRCALFHEPVDRIPTQINYTKAFGKKLAQHYGVIESALPGVQVMVCDTRAKRALTGSEYPERRAQCEQGAHILSMFHPEIQSLRNANLEHLRAHINDLDPVVYKRCKFIIEENQRVLAIAKALAAGNQNEIGCLALKSFEGARDLYEIVSREMIVMFEAIMSASGILGARGAGAGFGGCMVAFIQSNSIEPFSHQVREQYMVSTGI